MATLALGAVGTAFGGPVGGMLGASLGSYLDNRFIFPLLFPPDPPEQPALSDFKLGTSAEGTPIPYCIGTANRVAGQLIGMSGIKIVQVEERVGGGGGCGTGTPDQVIIHTFYFIDLAVAICRGEVNSILKIWADGDLIYDNDNTLTYASNTTISIAPFLFKFTGGPLHVQTRLRSPISGGVDLTQFKSGHPVTISGFANGVNNGTFMVIASYADSTFYNLVVLNPVPTIEAAGPSVTLAQTWSKRNKRRMTGITIYPGDLIQTPDPTLEGIYGAGLVPAYLGTSYAVINNLALNAYGNRIPNLSFLVKADATKTVAEAIGDIVENTGLTSNDYDTSGVS